MVSLGRGPRSAPVRAARVRRRGPAPRRRGRAGARHPARRDPARIPGVFSAVGLLIADLRVDKVWTAGVPLDRRRRRDRPSAFDRIQRARARRAAPEGYAGEPQVRRCRQHALPRPELRARGRGPRGADRRAGARGGVPKPSTRCTVHATATRSMARSIELVSFKVTAIGRRPAVELVQPTEPSSSARRTREVFFRGHGFVDATIVRRAALASGETIEGPALLEEEGSTTLVAPGMRVDRHPNGSLIIHDRGAAYRAPSYGLDPVTLTVIDNYLTEHVPRHGRDDDDDVVLADLQRVARLLVRDLRPAGQMLARPSSARRRSGRSSSRSPGRSPSSARTGSTTGDVVIHNDPYRGSGHVPEHMLLKPVFCDGELVAFVANVAPHVRGRRQDAGRALAATRRRSSRKGCCIPPVKMRRRGRGRATTSGTSSSPTTARRGSPTATSAR